MSAAELVFAAFALLSGASAGSGPVALASATPSILPCPTDTARAPRPTGHACATTTTVVSAS